MIQGAMASRTVRFIPVTISRSSRFPTHVELCPRRDSAGVRGRQDNGRVFRAVAFGRRRQ